MQNQGIGSVLEQIEHARKGFGMKRANVCFVHAPPPLSVQEGKKNHALVKPFIGLERKDIAVE